MYNIKHFNLAAKSTFMSVVISRRRSGKNSTLSTPMVSLFVVLSIYHKFMILAYAIKMYLFDVSREKFLYVHNTFIILCSERKALLQIMTDGRLFISIDSQKSELWNWFDLLIMLPVSAHCQTPDEATRNVIVTK